jgi:hypothetical protein
MHTKFWSENLKGGVHMWKLGVDGRIILKWTAKKYGWKLCTEFIWLRIGTSGGAL